MLPIAKTPIERPSIQVSLIDEAQASSAAPVEHAPGLGRENEPASSSVGLGADAPPPPAAMTTVLLKECGLCSVRAGKESWTAQAPSRVEDEENWVSIMESKVHASCLAQAFAEKLIVQVPVVERPVGSKVGVEDHREFATRCLEPQERLPLLCVVDGSQPPPLRPELLTEWSKPYAEVEVPVMASEPLATGFRLFSQLAPPRTLDDLLQSTSKMSKNGKMAEASQPIDIRRTMPSLWAEVRKGIPTFALPGGPCDLLWKDPRNRTRTSSVRLSIHSPGSILRAQRSRFRACSQLVSTGSQMDWAAVGAEDAERLLEASKDLRSPVEDPAWIPDVSFCVRHSARVYCGQQTVPGSMMLAFPGALYWAHVRGSSAGPTLLTQWSFAERSRLAFEYALSMASSGGAARPEELRELDACLDAREDVLNLRLFQEILKHDEERMHLLPKDLAEALVLRLLKACQETPVDAPRGATIPSEALVKVRCDGCRVELFDRRVYCAECDAEGQEQEQLLDLVATHPPRSSNKKDRSTLPDWLRVGCRVLVNLTVSGNSNDKPPRVVGAAHLPAMVLKTGHGFFTVHLEGSHEQVVKRKAAIEPHPDGPQLARGFRVKVRAEGGGGGEPQILLANLRESVFCCECFAKAHPSRQHPKKSTAYVDGRLELAKQFEAFKKDIVSRSSVRKDDLCVWNPRSPVAGGDDVPDDDPERNLPRLIPTVSAEAGQRAMHLAQVMGPSPYHYPGVPGGSPQGSKLLPPTAPLLQEEVLDRRLRTRKRVFSDMLDPLKPAGAARQSSGGSAETASRPGSGGVAQQKRSRSGSAYTAGAAQHQQHSQLDMVEEEPAFQHMEQHLAQAGLPQVGMHTALQGGSFFVGRKSLSILLEADAVVKAQAELLDANKHEDLRALWARARREVPLRKVWRFISLAETGGDQQMASKRRAIDALAESAAAAEPAPEVA